MSDIKDKIRKLIAHEKSARAIGNAAEAEAYKRHANTLLRRHKLTRKALAEAPKPAASDPLQQVRVSGSWKCTCGFSITLHIELPELFARRMIASTFGPHRGAGHTLTQTA
jgi:hypothetical protein